MLKRKPVAVAVQRLLAGVLPQECEQLRRLVTASQLLQQSLSAWCSQATRDQQTGIINGDQALGGTISAISAASGVQQITRSGYHTSSATAAGTRQSISNALARKKQQQQVQQQLKKLEQQQPQQNAASNPQQQRQGTKLRQHQHKQHRPQLSNISPSNRQGSRQLQEQQALQAYITYMEKIKEKQTVVQAADTTETSAAAGTDVAAVAAAVAAGHGTQVAKITKEPQQEITWDSSLLPSLISSLLANGATSTSSTSGSRECPAFSPEFQEFFHVMQQWWDDEQSTAAEPDDEGLEGLQDEPWYDIIAWLVHSDSTTEADSDGHADADTGPCSDADSDAGDAAAVDAGADVWADGQDWQPNSSVDQQHLLQGGPQLQAQQGPEGEPHAEQQHQHQQTLHRQQQDDVSAEQQQEQQQQLMQLTQEHQQQGNCCEDSAELLLAGDGDAWRWGEADTCLMQHQQQQQQHEWQTDQSQPYTISAAAAGLQWPLYINNVLLAIQYGTVQLTAGGRLGALIGAVDSTSNDNSISNDNSSSNDGSSTAAGVHEDECQQDSFAWMYSSSSSSSSSSAGDGVQFVLDALRDPWRFEVPYNSNNSSSHEVTGQQQQQQPAVATQEDASGSRVQDSVVDFFAGFLGVQSAEQYHHHHQQQQQQQQDVGVVSQQTPPSATPEVTTDTATGVTPPPSPAVTHGPVTRPRQSKHVSPVVLTHFELKPLGHPRYTEAELDILQGITNLARGTPLEAALWSEMSNQKVLVTGAECLVPGVNRMRLSRNTRVPQQQQQQQQQSHQQPASCQVATAQQQKEAQVHSYFSDLSGKGQLPELRWFVDLAAAAFMTARAAGQSVSAAVSVPGHTGPGKAQKLNDAQQQQQDLATADAAGVVMNRRPPPHEVCSMLKKGISDSSSIDRLLEMWGLYPHYWSQYPDAVEVMLQKASQLWAAPPATQGNSRRLEQLIADTWRTTEQEPEPETAAAAAADTGEGADAVSSAAQEPPAAAAAAPSRSTILTIMANSQHNAELPAHEGSSSAELFRSLVDWYLGQHVMLQTPPPVDLLAQLRAAQPGSSSNNNSTASPESSKHASARSPSSAEPKEAVRQLILLFTAAVNSSSGSCLLQPSQESLPIPELVPAITAGLPHLDASELLDLYFTLMQWANISRWNQQQQLCAAELYQEVVQQLASRQQPQHELPRLLTVAEQACAASSRRAVMPGQGHQNIMRAAADAAVAAGHLQQLAGMAAPLLRKMVQQQQQLQQQQQALPAGLVMEQLAPRLSRLLQAAAAATTTSVKGNKRLQELASSIAGYLRTPQQQQQQLGSAAPADIQLQVPLSILPASKLVAVLTALHEMQLESEDAAVSSTICQTQASSSSHGKRSGVPLLHSFTAGQMFELVKRGLLKGRDLDLLAAAAAHRVKVVTHLLRRGPSVSGGPSEPAVSDIVTEIDTLSKIVMVYYRDDLYQPQLMDALGGLLEASRSSRARKTFTADSLSWIASSLAKFKHCSRPAAEAVQACVSALLPDCSVPEVARLAWALAVLDQRDATLWGNIQAAIAHSSAREVHKLRGGAWKSHSKSTADADAERQVAKSWGGGTLAMLYQASLFVRYHAPVSGDLLSPHMAVLAKSTWERSTASVSVSQLQRNISHAISALQAQPHARVHRYLLETRTELSSADILVRVGDQDVVVEVDGPVHYADNHKYLRLGSSELRDLLQAAAGYQVLPIPYFVWSVFERMKEEDRLRELNKMLQQVAKNGKILWQTAEWCKRYNLPYDQLVRSCRPTVAAHYAK